MVKDNYYKFIIENFGIDIEIEYFDLDKKSFLKDHSYGLSDPSNIDFKCKKSGVYTIIIKPKVSSENTKKGFYSILLNSSKLNLTKFNYSKLVQDFDILQNAYIETRVGLWYNSRIQFDSICNLQKSKIKDKMSSLDLYQILAPIVSFTKEGHCKIGISDELNLFSKQNYKYLPLLVKIINDKVYILNQINNLDTKGMMISKINGVEIDKIMKLFLTIHPSDGFNYTGKYHRIERRFSQYYTNFINNNSINFNLEIINPITNNVIKIDNISTLNYEEFTTSQNELLSKLPNYSYNEVSFIKIENEIRTATITFNNFATNKYKDGKLGFQKIVESYFKTISDNNIENLIIDVRKNEGGEQGMEDYLLSYLITDEYLKYKYVEIPSFNFTFLQHTTYNTKISQKEFEESLKEEFFVNKDGRYLNIKGMYEGEKPKKNNFKGKLFILINGLTFSGGSEFAALAKNYTNAKFIGEETGGGYYGNTSGTFLNFTLPNTGLKGRIPLCKFVVETKEYKIPFGRGILPDYQVQPTINEFLNNFDAEMEFTKKMINK